MDIILTLIYEFFKTGLFSVGGGLATIPFLQDMIVKYGWFSADILSTMIAVSESTPGPIGVNMATYVGYITAGPLGGVVTTLSLVTPSVIIVCIIATMLQKFKESKTVEAVFYGLRAAVVGLILSAVLPIFILTLFKYNTYLETKQLLDVFNIINIVIFAIVYFAYKKFKINPILVIVLCAVLGIIFQL